MGSETDYKRRTSYAFSRSSKCFSNISKWVISSLFLSVSASRSFWYFVYARATSAHYRTQTSIKLLTICALNLPSFSKHFQRYHCQSLLCALTWSLNNLR